MTKAKFLQAAKEKYRLALEKKWVAEMNFIFSPQLILRVWFDNEIQSEILANQNAKVKRDDVPLSAHCHIWCTVEDLEDEKIFDKFDEFLCEDREDFPLILSALKKAWLKDKSQMIDHLEYKKGVSITPIEALEFTYTVESFCEAVGLDLNIPITK